jgi:hypothetical protein
MLGAGCPVPVGISMAEPNVAEAELIPGRECGDCNVCCVALTIDDAELRKPQGYRCRNATKDNKCAIYERRPRTCSDFNCGWRQLKWVKQPLRPDLSGVLIRQQYEVAKDGKTAELGIIVTLLTNASLKAEGLAETVAAAVTAGVPVHLHVPGPPGYTAGHVRINEVLVGAVQARDKAAVLEILRRARAKGRSGKHEPIVLGKGPA